MSTCKSSTITGALAKKTVDWMEVPDKELATDLDDTDSVEEAERCQKEEERQQKEAEAEQKWKDEKAKRATAAEARKQQRADSEAQVSGSRTNASVCISGCQEKVGVWVVCEGQREMEHKKWVKKAADDDDDDEIVILSSQKAKWQGGGETLEEITNRRWGKLIQVVSTHMDVANGHLERIASTAQSNSHKVQWHHLLMEGLVGQQQVLLSKLVEGVGATGSGGAGEVIEDSEELKEMQETQGEGLGGQEEMQGVPGGVPEDALEDVPGNGPENGTGAEDGAEEEAQKDKGKGKEKAT
ncbi:hypothetical protein ID866_12400 [Astraeus odoratus]|nr:hypothetical protein ID866_12400 [Astraeus odoratus]